MRGNERRAVVLDVEVMLERDVDRSDEFKARSNTRQDVLIPGCILKINWSWLLRAQSVVFPGVFCAGAETMRTTELFLGEHLSTDQD